MGFQQGEADQAKKACVLCGNEFPGNVELCPDDGTLLTPIGKEPRVGDIIADRYEILGVLGDGGMGKVYKARHNLMKRVVAIKMLLPHLVSSGPALKRFQQEAQAASALKHPHIMTVHDFGISDRGMPFLVMDYLEGVSLSSVLQDLGNVPQDRAVNIFIQACSALSHAHKNGVVHRDLKPANLMLIDFDGQPDFLMVVDFGIAKLLQPDGAVEQLTHTGEVFGSPLYMSPEQCRGRELDPRSDIYSLGCVIYRTVTGRPVFGGRDAMECMFKQVNDMPGSFAEVCPEFRLSEGLEAAVFKSLAKEPEDRFQTMAEFRDALEEVKGPAKPVSRVFAVPPQSGQEVAYDVRTDRLRRQTKQVDTKTHYSSDYESEPAAYTGARPADSDSNRAPAAVPPVVPGAQDGRSGAQQAVPPGTRTAPEPGSSNFPIVSAPTASSPGSLNLSANTMSSGAQSRQNPQQYGGPAQSGGNPQPAQEDKSQYAAGPGQTGMNSQYGANQPAPQPNSQYAAGAGQTGGNPQYSQPGAQPNPQYAAGPGQQTGMNPQYGANQANPQQNSQYVAGAGQTGGNPQYSQPVPQQNSQYAAGSGQTGANPQYGQPQIPSPQYPGQTGANPQYGQQQIPSPQYPGQTGANPQYGQQQIPGQPYPGQAGTNSEYSGPSGSNPQYGQPGGSGPNPQYPGPSGSNPQYGQPGGSGPNPQYPGPSGSNPQYGQAGGSGANPQYPGPGGSNPQYGQAGPSGGNPPYQGPSGSNPQYGQPQSPQYPGQTGANQQYLDPQNRQTQLPGQGHSGQMPQPQYAEQAEPVRQYGHNAQVRKSTQLARGEADDYNESASAGTRAGRGGRPAEKGARQFDDSGSGAGAQTGGQAQPLKLALIGGGVVVVLLIAGLVIMSMSKNGQNTSSSSSTTTASANKGASSGNNPFSGANQDSSANPHLSEAKSLIASGNYQNAEKTLTTAAGTAGSDRELAEVLPLQARVFEQSGKFLQAQEAWQKLLSIQQKTGASQPDIARTKSQLALPILEQGNVEAAEPLLTDAEKILSNAPEQEKEGLAHVYYGLSKVALYKGDYTKATETLEAAISRLTKVEGTDDPELVQFYKDLAEIYMRQDMTHDAEAMLDKMLKLAEEKFGKDSAEAAEAYKDLGTVAFKKGQLSKCENFYKKSLAIKSKDFGANSVAAAEVMTTMAMLYTKERKFQLAEPLFKSSLEIRKRELGEDSPQAKRTSQLYATMLKVKGSR